MDQTGGGRKTAIAKVPAEPGNRDAGKHYLITEWPAETAEKWALRAFLAYNRGGGELELDKVAGMGMDGIFALGVQTFLRGQMKAEEIIPILDDLLQCVKLIRDPTKRSPDGSPIATPIVSPDDISEVRTRLWLRSEVLKLHTGFSLADALFALISLVSKTKAPASSTT